MSKNKNITMMDDFEWNDESNSFDFLKFYLIIKRLLPWIIVCSLLGIVGAFTYLKFKKPVYQVKAKVLIKESDPKMGGLMKNADMLQNLGIMTGSSSVDNELEIIKAYSILDKVVKDLELNFSYTKKGVFDDEFQNSIDMPWETRIIRYNDKAFENEQKYIIKVSGNNSAIKYENTEIKFKWNEPVKLPIGIFVFKTKPGSVFHNEEWELTVEKPTVTTDKYIENIKAEIPNKQTSIINLELDTQSPELGKKVLDRLVNTYITDNVKDNNSINDSTMVFITDRLVEVTKELQDVEKAIQNFKQKNNVTDITEQTKVLLDATKDNSQQLIQSEIQLNVVTSLENYLKNNKAHIIPSGLLTQDISLSNLINQYNGLIVQKDKLSQNATSENPVIINLNNQIVSVKNELLNSIRNTKNSYTIVANQLRNQSDQNINQIKKIPEQERQFLDISRQQAIKQELYLFLLKKREETAIGKSSTISNIRVIDYGRVLDKPISPKKTLVLAIGLILGISLPFIVYYIRKTFNIKIESKSDIEERTKMPIIAEVGHQDEPSIFEVKENPRSSLAEQFRILRTNLHFYQHQNEAFTIMLTSSMPGEGKTFISMNLAATLAANIGVKVLLIGLDLRKPQLAKELGMQKRKGFTECVINDAKLEEVIYPIDGFKNLWVLPSGSVPPNPAELLMTKEAETIFDSVKKQFDFIIVDCPPIIVTDSHITGKYVDLTLYISRMGYTEKRQIEMANDLFHSEKMPKMNLIVNDFDPEKYDQYNSNYYYQYGYYENHEVKKTWWKKWFKI